MSLVFFFPPPSWTWRLFSSVSGNGISRLQLSHDARLGVVRMWMGMIKIIVARLKRSWDLVLGALGMSVDERFAIGNVAHLVAGETAAIVVYGYEIGVLVEEEAVTVLVYEPPYVGKVVVDPLHKITVSLKRP